MTDTAHTPSPIALDLDFNKKSLTESLLLAWQSVLASFKNGYVATADTLIDEVLVMLTEEQVNAALKRFVTDNVGMILELKMELHDDWLRLYCTVNVKGIFASVACNFRLVQAQLTADTQRFVFEQLSDTEILTLHSKKWWQAVAARLALKGYRQFYKKDPLPIILHKITVKNEPFATYDNNIIHLDIHRYLAKQRKILNYLRKVQVNHGSTQAGKLILRTQPNFAEILSLGDSGEDIITEKDNPDRPKKEKKE